MIGSTGDPPSQLQEFKENFDWIKAIKNWDAGYYEDLAWLIEHYHVPAKLKPVIGDIIRGVRNQNAKGVSNEKYKPSDRLQIAFDLDRKISGAHSLADTKHLKYLDLQEYLRSNAPPLKLRKAMLSVIPQYKKQVADKYQIKLRTVDKYLEQFRNIRKKWPNL